MSPSFRNKDIALMSHTNYIFEIHISTVRIDSHNLIRFHKIDVDSLQICMSSKHATRSLPIQIVYNNQQTFRPELLFLLSLFM